MSLRLLVALALLAIAIIWTMRRPFIGVCVVVILFHLNPRVFGTGLEDIRFQFYITLVLVLSFIINHQQLKEALVPNQLPMKLMYAYLVVVFLTSLWAVADTELAFDSAIDFAKIVLFAGLMTKIVRSEKEFHILIWVMLISVGYTGFMARWGVEFGWIDDLEIGIATGGTGTHMLMHFPLLVTIAMTGSKWEKRAAYLIMPLILDAMTVLPEGFRSSFVNLVTGLALYLVFAPGRLRIKSLIPFGVGAVLFIYVFAPPGYWEYMSTILAPSTESSAASRAVINDASYQIVMENPMGIGYNNYSRVSMNYIPEENLTDEGTRDAHNSYLKVLAEFGFLGLGLWILMFFATWIYFQKIRKTGVSGEEPDKLQLYAMALSVGLISITLAIYTHSYNDLDTLYWFVALSAIMYNLKFQKEMQEANNQAAAYFKDGLQQDIPTPPVDAAVPVQRSQ